MRTSSLCLIFIQASFAFQSNSDTSPQCSNDFRCMEEFNISDEDARRFTTTLAYDKNNYNFKCAIRCSLINRGFMDESGDFLMGLLVHRFNNGDIPEVVAEYLTMTLFDCLEDIDSTDLCEKAAEGQDCLTQVIYSLGPIKK